MVFRFPLAYIFAAVSLLSPFQQQQQVVSDRAWLFNKLGDTNCEMIDLYLNEYAQGIRKQPESHAPIIAYIGRNDWLGKIPRYVSYIKSYLSDLVEKDSRSVTVVNGGYRDNLSIELWIVPNRVSAPSPTESTPEVKPNEQVPYKFDETEAVIMEYNKKSYLSFGLLCTLPYPEWGEFFRILGNDQNLKGHIIIYVGQNETRQYANRIRRFLITDLIKDYSEEVKQLTTSYGGKREWSQIEIWLVPKDKPNPKPTPRSRNAKAHSASV